VRKISPLPSKPWVKTRLKTWVLVTSKTTSRTLQGWPRGAVVRVVMKFSFAVFRPVKEAWRSRVLWVLSRLSRST